jgi:hypothetical protein
MKLRSTLALAIIIATVLLAVSSGFLVAALFLFVAGNALALPSPGGRLCVTLTAEEILSGVIKAFAVRLPYLAGLGVEFKPSSLKLNKEYTGHISTVPTVRDYDGTTGYKANAAAARDHLVDVPVTVTRHRHVPLKWTHLTQIADDKQAYERVIANAGYALARNFALDLAAEFKARNFSQTSTFAAADCDVDMLTDIAGDMNGVGAMTEGRTLWLNTAAANALALDSRMASRDFTGQQVGASSRRRWTNCHGFAVIEEWPELPSNNGTALTSVTGANTGDLFTKTAHGLVTGDRVTAASFSAGFSDGTYFVIRASDDTFQLASTAANAVAGTAVAITADGTGGVITPTENVAGFAFTQEMGAVLAGPPQADDESLMSALNIPRVMGFTEPVTEPDSGITMAAVSWQEVGLGDLYWSPVLLWGKAMGRQAGSVAAGSICDYAGHRIITG